MGPEEDIYIYTVVTIGHSKFRPCVLLSPIMLTGRKKRKIYKKNPPQTYIELVHSVKHVKRVYVVYRTTISV